MNRRQQFRMFKHEKDVFCVMSIILREQCLCNKRPTIDQLGYNKNSNSIKSKLLILYNRSRSPLFNISYGVREFYKKKHVIHCLYANINSAVQGPIFENRRRIFQKHYINYNELLTNCRFLRIFPNVERQLSLM